MATELRAATYANARARTDYVDGQFVYVEGRANVHDGGQGVFQVSPVGSLSDDDGLTLVAGTKALRRTHSNTIDVTWFGADPTGVADSTQAFKDAVAYIGVGSTGLTRGVIEVPPGRYKISDEILVDRARITFKAREAVLEWMGAANKSIFRVINSQKCQWLDFVFLGSKTALPGDTSQPGPPLAAINMDKPTSSVLGVNEYHEVIGCTIGTLNGQLTADAYPLQNGILIGGVVDGNNDKFYIARSYFQSCTDSGVKISNTQSIWGFLDNCTFNTCDIGVQVGANVQMNMVRFNRCSSQDIKATRKCEIKVTGYYSEHPVQPFYGAAGPSLSIDGGKCLISDATVTPDVYWCNFAPGGRVTLKNLNVELAAGTTATPRLKYYPVSGEHGFVSTEACELPQFPDGDWHLIQDNGGTTSTVIIDGNDWNDRSGTATYDPPSIAADGVETTTVTVTGAALGDVVSASFSLSLGGLMMSAEVSAADTVTVTLFNPTGSAIDLGSGTLTAKVSRE